MRAFITYVSRHEAVGRQMDGATWGTHPGYYLMTDGGAIGPFTTQGDALARKSELQQKASA